MLACHCVPDNCTALATAGLVGFGSTLRCFRTPSVYSPEWCRKRGVAPGGRPMAASSGHFSGWEGGTLRGHGRGEGLGLEAEAAGGALDLLGKALGDEEVVHRGLGPGLGPEPGARGGLPDSPGHGAAALHAPKPPRLSNSQLEVSGTKESGKGTSQRGWLETFARGTLEMGTKCTLQHFPGNGGRTSGLFPYVVLTHVCNG
jgi:hypothetical protein